MWKSKNGKVWHRFNDCVCISTICVKINEISAEKISQCKRCIFRTTCDICMVDNACMPLCNLHVACRTCFENSISKSYECPFDGRNLVDIPFRCLSKKNTPATHVCPIDYTIENVLTLKCPSCKQAFYDFDACLLLRCNNCEKSFCGLCLEMIKSHDHILTCPLRTDLCNGYFMNFEDWQTFHNEIKTKKIMEIRNTLYKQSIFMACVYHIEMMRFHNMMYFQYMRTSFFESTFRGFIFAQNCLKAFNKFLRLCSASVHSQR